jgi:hypothetical protein
MDAKGNIGTKSLLESLPDHFRPIQECLHSVESLNENPNPTQGQGPETTLGYRLAVDYIVNGEAYEAHMASPIDFASPPLFAKGYSSPDDKDNNMLNEALRSASKTAESKFVESLFVVLARKDLFSFWKFVFPHRTDLSESILEEAKAKKEGAKAECERQKKEKIQAQDRQDTNMTINSLLTGMLTGQIQFTGRLQMPQLQSPFPAQVQPLVQNPRPAQVQPSPQQAAQPRGQQAQRDNDSGGFNSEPLPLPPPDPATGL